MTLMNPMTVQVTGVTAEGEAGVQNRRTTTPNLHQQLNGLVQLPFSAAPLANSMSGPQSQLESSFCLANSDTFRDQGST